MRLFRFVPDFPTLGPAPAGSGAHLILAPAPAAPARLASRLQFLHAVEGTFEFRANGRRVILGPKSYVLFDPSVSVTVLPAPASRGRLFGAAAAEGETGSFYGDTRVPDAFVSPLLADFCLAVQRGEMGRKKAEQTIRDLLAAAARRDDSTRAQLGTMRERETTRADLFSRILRAREFMDAHCGELPTAARAAQIACMSVAHFHRCFAQIVGQTPHRYLTQRRLEQARARLRHSREPIARLSHSLGFECAWTLTALFRRTYGLTPAQYRAGLEPAQALAA